MMRAAGVAIIVAAHSAAAFVSPPLLISAARPSCARGLRAARGAGLEAGDTVTVIGASSPVGRLLAQDLLKDGRFRVRLIANNPEAAEIFKAYPDAEVYVGNLAQDPKNGNNLSLLAATDAAKGLDRLGMTVPIVSARRLLRDSAAVVIAEGTSCFPSTRWLYGLSPRCLDGRGIQNVLSCMEDGTAKRLIYLSCIGAQRELSRGIPKLDANILFWVLNIFGALDAKRGGEQLVRDAQKRLGIDTVIVRSKLHCYESGPFAGLPEEAFDDMRYQGVNLIPGDFVDGESSDVATAGVLLQALTQAQAGNKEMCVVNSQGSPPGSQLAWDNVFAELEVRERQMQELVT